MVYDVSPNEDFVLNAPDGSQINLRDLYEMSIGKSVKYFGAVADGVTDDTVAIQAAADNAPNGGVVTLTGLNKVYIISQITLPLQVTLRIPSGVILRRPAGHAQTGPMVIIQRNRNRIEGGGIIECLNDCSSGILRVERTDGTCEWARVNDISVRGPGETVAGSTGVVFSGTQTFQNRLNGIIVSDVETGIRHEGGANMNHCTDVTMFNIGAKMYDFDGTLESSVIGGSISSSTDITCFTLRNAATNLRIMGVLMEPGGSSFLRSITSGCNNNQFIGVVANLSSLGTDSGLNNVFLTETRFILGASATNHATLNVPHGTAPTTPTNGDMWTTTAGLFVRINGVTVGPLS